MSQILQWIGTFASIISVPLAIFFYYKTIDGKYEKVKKELVSLFSSYIGTGNKLSLFYLSSVINAKLRENNLKVGSITTISIIEDLIVAIISNPLLANDAKKSILSDLEMLVCPAVKVPDGKLAGGLESKNVSTEDNVEERRKKLAEALRRGDPVTIEREMDKNKEQTPIIQKLSNIIGVVSALAAILSFLISTGQVTDIFEIIDLTSTGAQILLGVIASIIASLVFALLEKVRKKK